MRVQLGTDAALLSEPEQGSTDNPQKDNTGIGAQAQHICLSGSSLDTRRGLAFATRAPGP